MSKLISNPLTLALLTAFTVASGVAACTEQVDTGSNVEEIKGRGIVDCNAIDLNKKCKECGTGGTTVCCDPYYELGCDVVCNNWKQNKETGQWWCSL